MFILDLLEGPSRRFPSWPPGTLSPHPHGRGIGPVPGGLVRPPFPLCRGGGTGRLPKRLGQNLSGIVPSTPGHPSGVVDGCALDCQSVSGGTTIRRDAPWKVAVPT